MIPFVTELPYAEAIEAQARRGSTRSPPSVCCASTATACVAWLRRRWPGSSPRCSCQALAAGKRPDEIFGLELAHRLTVLMESAVVELYRLIQKGAWTAVIIEGLEMQLAAAGLHSRLEHPPAMCFLDITGSTGLAQERGRPVKWLGDGVMLHYKDPGPGVVAPLEMVAGGAEAGLPPLHVGLHAGPMIFQEGDYYSQTVNVASRIADYARPGEVLVSQEVVDASSGADVIFREIGPVELKGVAGAMRLHTASGPP
jgi:hypothetical protein